MATAQVSLCGTYDQVADEMRQAFVAKQEASGAWRKELVPAGITGLPRDMYIYRAPRRTDPLTFSWHGDKETFCPPRWWDLAIGSGSCGFGCRACFLLLTFRAMRDPFRPVIYDNEEYIWGRVSRWLGSAERRRTHSLGLGIDRSDSLLYEGLTGHARQLIPWFGDPDRNVAGCSLILLTKSANTHFLPDAPRRSAPVAVTFSVNPEPITDLWEGKYPETGERISPPIRRRLEAAREAQDKGYEVRFRLDPILTPPGWEDMYSELLAGMAEMGLRPTRVTLGTYRRKNSQLDAWRRKWGLPPMEWEPKELANEGTHWHVSQEQRRLAYTRIAEEVKGFLPCAVSALCKETHGIRKACGMTTAKCNCLG